MPCQVRIAQERLAEQVDVAERRAHEAQGCCGFRMKTMDTCLCFSLKMDKTMESDLFMS